MSTALLPRPTSVAAAYSDLSDLSTGFVPPPATALDDAALIGAQRSLSEIGRRVDAAAALIAAEIAHRSRRELGYEGLAQRLGARTPELLVQQVTGSSAREAHALVRVGSFVAGSGGAGQERPWLRDVAATVAAGTLSIDAADAISAGLGVPDDSGLTADALFLAAAQLLREADTLSVEKLAGRARDARVELELARDDVGVRERESQLREKRYLRLSRQADGMTRLNGLLDPESAARVTTVFDAVTSPRRGGPRFVDPRAVERSERILRDPRTTEQLALDVFVDLLRVAALSSVPVKDRDSSSNDLGPRADLRSDRMLGSRGLAVHVLITEHDLRTRQGLGRIEGQTEPISVESVQRAACESGILPILFDTDGQVVNIGRSQRLFTPRQRIGLAARDGGCRFVGCDRPASWTEAHHINEWERDHGRTDIADGILLCRHHHMLVHNNGWCVIRRGANYFIVPPESVDPKQVPIPAPPKSPMARRLFAGIAR